MFGALMTRVRARVAALAIRVKTALLSACHPTNVVCGIVTDVARSRSELIAENVLIRQQLVVASRTVKRPAFRPHERGLIVLLARLVPLWRNALLLVRPETVLRWHRLGFQLLWRWRSCRRRSEPRLAPDTISLIERMARDNVLWGSERIRGELLKLGIRVAKRTIQKYMRRGRDRGPHRGPPWLTFLRNHSVWACDFLQTYDVWFRPIFAFFIVDVNTKRVVHVAVTRAPTEQWTAQQMREATPFGRGPRFIIRDRDDKYGSAFDRVAKGAGFRVLKTAVRAPLMNSVCERFLGSVRRECLDHVIILNERHFLRTLSEYALSYFNIIRPHQGIGQRIPVPSALATGKSGPVVAVPILGGLHHDYQIAA